MSESTETPVDLSLLQAAARLGKSPRQVRYLIKSGALPARKVSNRWVISSQDLPTSDGQTAATERRQLQLRTAVEDGLALPEPSTRQRGSVHNLKAFSLGVPLHDRASEALGEQHAATRTLRAMLDHLARGYHRYDYSEKATAYRAARDAASSAVCELVLSKHAAARELISEIEQNLMAAIAGVLRRLDRKRTSRAA